MGRSGLVVKRGWVGLWVGMGGWFEGHVGECESCHILVIYKCIICLHEQIYNNNKS